jgi:hypothetical protein
LTCARNPLSRTLLPGCNTLTASIHYKIYMLHRSQFKPTEKSLSSWGTTATRLRRRPRLSSDRCPAATIRLTGG